MPLSYRHDGKRHDVLVRLAGVHAEAELLDLLAAHPPAEPGGPPKPEKRPPPGRGRKEKPRGPPQPPPRPAAAGPRSAHARDPQATLRRAARFRQLLFQRSLPATGLEGVGCPQPAPRPAQRRLDAGGNGGRGKGIPFGYQRCGRIAKTPLAEHRWTAGDELGRSLLPPQSGGLLPALYLWRRLATEGLDRFGDVYYAGTAPVAGQPGLADVLVGSCKGVECRFYFDPLEGQMIAMEMFADENADPCEIYFSGYRAFDGRMLPGRMYVRFGDDPYAELEIKQFQCGKSEPAAKPEEGARRRSNRAASVASKDFQFQGKRQGQKCKM